MRPPVTKWALVTFKNSSAALKLKRTPHLGDILISDKAERWRRRERGREAFMTRN